jgi:hypothetical protein
MRKRLLRPYKNAELHLFVIDLEPAEITRKLRIEPDECWRRGEPTAWGKTRVGGWVLKSGTPPGSEAEEHIESILKRIRPAKRQFRALQRDLTQCYIGLVLTVCDKFPGAGFLIPARQLSELGQFGIDVGFTAYPDGKPVRWKKDKGERKQRTHRRLLRRKP